MPCKDKIVGVSQASEIIAAWKTQGLQVVFTNGCFDILHLGHVDYLEKSAACGDVMVLGLNADSSISKLKGPTRPINDEIARARIMASLAFIDLVVIFDQETPIELITALEPNMLVKGDDYDATCVDSTDKKYIVGSDIVRKLGGKVLTISMTEGYSTSAIIKKIEG